MLGWLRVQAACAVAAWTVGSQPQGAVNSSGCWRTGAEVLIGCVYYSQQRLLADGCRGTHRVLIVLTAAAAGGRVQLLSALGSEVCFSLHDFRFGAEVLSFGMALDATLLDPQ